MSAVTDEPESTSQVSEPAVEGEEESPAYTSLDELINVGINIGDIKKAKDAGYVHQPIFFWGGGRAPTSFEQADPTVFFI